MHHRPSTIRTLTREQVRELDRRAIEAYGIPGVVLMENAAAAIEEVVLTCLGDLPADSSVLVLCGPGNNGGDGLALARRLQNRAVPVEVFLTADDERYAGDAAVMLHIVRCMGISCSVLDLEDVERVLPADPKQTLIVDALLGTGLDRPVRAGVSEVVAWVKRARNAGAFVVAVDVPSGLDADSGEVLGVAVQADVTVTLAAMKPGLTLAPEIVGRVEVGDIGVPTALLDEVGG